MSREFHGHFFSINKNSLGLQVGLPDFLGVALREADIAAVLLAFAGDVTLLHKALVYRFSPLKSTTLVQYGISFSALSSLKL